MALALELPAGIETRPVLDARRHDVASRILPAARAAPSTARLTLSVAPEVKTMASGGACTSRATCARAASSQLRRLPGRRRARTRDSPAGPDSRGRRPSRRRRADRAALSPRSRGTRRFVDGHALTPRGRRPRSIAASQPRRIRTSPSSGAGARDEPAHAGAQLPGVALVHESTAAHHPLRGGLRARASRPPSRAAASPVGRRHPVAPCGSRRSRPAPPARGSGTRSRPRRECGSAPGSVRAPRSRARCVRRRTAPRPAAPPPPQPARQPPRARRSRASSRCAGAPSCRSPGRSRRSPRRSSRRCGPAQAGPRRPRRAPPPRGPRATRGRTSTSDSSPMFFIARALAPMFPGCWGSTSTMRMASDIAVP